MYLCRISKGLGFSAEVKRNIDDLIASGVIETGRGQNQAKSMDSLAPTRWYARMYTLKSIESFFNSVVFLLRYIHINDNKSDVRFKAQNTLDLMQTFHFFFCLALMIELLCNINTLSLCLQAKKMNYIVAVQHIKAAKNGLVELKSQVGFLRVLLRCNSLCEIQQVAIPDLKSKYVRPKVVQE